MHNEAILDTQLSLFDWPQGRQCETKARDHSRAAGQDAGRKKGPKNIESLAMNFLFDLRGVSGIYLAFHRETLMSYVGSSVNMGRRSREHVRDAYLGKKKALCSAIRKYGVRAFTFAVLELCPKENLLDRENVWIDWLKSADAYRGFNVMPTATSLPVAYCPQKSTIERQRIWRTGRKFTPEQRANVSAGQIGKKHSQITKDKIRDRALGRKVSLETRLKLSEIHKGKFKGRKLSPETCAKIKANHRGTTGQKRTPEQRARMQASAVKRWNIRSISSTTL